MKAIRRAICWGLAIGLALGVLSLPLVLAIGPLGFVIAAFMAVMYAGIIQIEA